ncbi:MAG: hypothetical protein KGJ62_01385 [Armatimonadetes bacterium]|nr:hypothetical protein [Armatimonadota bacterium]MDE2205842.1 hypothetical protein [Armatimonadota bacterium]
MTVLPSCRWIHRLALVPAACMVLAAGSAAAPHGNRRAPAPPKLCVSICNHWSYTGIGWQLGIESDVLSLQDAMQLADRAGLRTCVDLDARAWDRMRQDFPDVVKRFARYVKAGKVEVIGGTYGQPMGTMFSGESNIRQLIYGRAAIVRALGQAPTTFLDEEEFSHPQLPQILVSDGYRYASLSQLDTWGKAGIPEVDADTILWKGKDRTEIPTAPKNALFEADLNWPAISATPAFKALSKQGMPLATVWEEYGWERPEGPSWKSDAPFFKNLAAHAPVKYVTLTQYMQEYGSHPKSVVRLKMDDWDKSLTWGLGGDQLRIYNREVENSLLNAERFDAIDSTMGGPNRSSILSTGWKHLLASQSHDVGLCEYSRWQQDRMAPLHRLEDHHNFTWGDLGYNLLDLANAAGGRVLAASLHDINRRIDTGRAAPGTEACTVFNGSPWARSGIVETGRIYPIPGHASSVVVRDAEGQAVPTQLVSATRNREGGLVAARVEFAAANVPALGYRVFHVVFGRNLPQARSRLVTDTAQLSMENPAVSVRLDRVTGAIDSLVDRRTGQQMAASGANGYPVFRGQPNTAYPLRSGLPAEYDSSKTHAQVSWVVRGPVRSTLKARFGWNGLVYETYISVDAVDPYVEVTTRLLTQAPPAPDVDPKVIRKGYWLSFAPAFKPETIVRDYPLAIGTTTKSEFHALTFVDMLSQNAGLLLLHSGTEWFRMEPSGEISNLVMREWESTYSGEYGWPRYAQYRHALMPHGPGFTNADRVHAATDFTNPMIALLAPPHPGRLAPQGSFVSVSPSAAELTELRQLPGGGLEFRLLNTGAGAVYATVRLPGRARAAVETNLVGTTTGTCSTQSGAEHVPLGPWRFQTVVVR